jgi:anti-sigma-K factor RskA
MSTDLHTLSGAYAVDALSPHEAAEFRTHLAGCEACRQEVRELRQAAARMGAGAAASPPAALRARVLAAADQTPQLPPRTTPIEVARRRWLPRLLGAAAAVVLVAGAAFGVAQLRDDTGQVPATVAQVFAAPDAHTTRVQTSNGGTIVVATSEELRRMAVDTDALPRLDRSRVYQLWTIADGTPKSVGLLTDVDAGKALRLPGRGTTVAITVEPAGGSRLPTTEPIAAVEPARSAA